MKLFDTHCHLDFPVLRENIEEVLKRARQAGVRRFLVPGVNAEGWPLLMQLCSEHEGLYPALGLHPCFLQSDHAADLELLEGWLNRKPEIIAVGEVGLDLFIPQADLKFQLSVLQPQLVLAKQFDKPVLLHVRKAHDQMLKLLRQVRLNRGGIVHAFSGSEQQAREYLKLGFKLGIGGSITYPRAKKLQRLVTQLPLDSFVLETDAPDMPLSGFQGQVNFPERAARVLQEIARIRQEPVSEVAQSVTIGSMKLMGLDEEY